MRKTRVLAALLAAIALLATACGEPAPTECSVEETKERVAADERSKRAQERADAALAEVRARFGNEADARFVSHNPNEEVAISIVYRGCRITLKVLHGNIHYGGVNDLNSAHLDALDIPSLKACRGETSVPPTS